MRPGYIVAVVPAKGAAPDQAEALWRLAHDTFTRAMHERIATSVMTAYADELRDEYLQQGGDPERWPEALGSGFDPLWKVPFANAVVFGDATVDASQARTVVEAITSERMLAVLLPSGRIARVTGMTGSTLLTG